MLVVCRTLELVPLVDGLLPFDVSSEQDTTAIISTPVSPATMQFRPLLFDALNGLP